MIDLSVIERTAFGGAMTQRRKAGRMSPLRNPILDACKRITLPIFAETDFSGSNPVMTDTMRRARQRNGLIAVAQASVAEYTRRGRWNPVRQ